MFLYFAKDGNYGDADGLVTLDLDSLGFPVGSLFDNLSDDDRAPVATALDENASLIRLSRALLGTDTPNGEDPETWFPEYLRGQAELIRDMLGSALVELEDVEALLTLSPEA